MLISGAGNGGLALAILLHKAKVTFTVFERAHEIKPLGKCCIKFLRFGPSEPWPFNRFRTFTGSAVANGSSVIPLFKRVRIYDELVNCGKYYNRRSIFKEDLEYIYSMDMSWLKKVQVRDLKSFIVNHRSISCTNLLVTASVMESASFLDRSFMITLDSSPQGVQTSGQAGRFLLGEQRKRNDPLHIQLYLPGPKPR